MWGQLLRVVTQGRVHFHSSLALPFRNREFHATSFVSGGRHTTGIPERQKHWRKHISKKALKRYARRKEKLRSTGRLVDPAKALALRGPVAALPPSRVLAAQSKANRTTIESLVLTTPGPPTPVQALRTQNPDTLLKRLRSGAVPRSAEQYNHALRVLGAHHRLEDAIKLWESMAADGIAPSEATYDALLAACAVERNPSAAAAVLEAMSSVGLRPTAASFGSLMQAHVRSADIDGSLRVLQDAAAAGVPLTPVLFTHAIVGCIHDGQYDRAWEIFNEMRTRHCEPDAVTYTALINACAKTDKVERALNLLVEMKQLGVAPTHMTYNAAIQAAGRSLRKHEEAHALLSEMRSAGYAPDLYSYTGVILACSHMGEVGRARAYLYELCGEGLEPDAVMLNTVLAVYARALSLTSKTDKALVSQARTSALSDGKQLLAWDDPELAEQLKSRIKPTLHEVGRLVDGDIDAHVEQILADYFADDKGRPGNADLEDKVLHTSREDAAQDEDLVPEIRTDATAPGHIALTKALVQTGLLDERTATEYIDNAMRGADVDSSDAEIPSRHEVEAHEEREEAFRAETEAAVLELGRKAAELDAREQEVVARLPRKPGWLLRGEKFPGETDEDADSVRGSAEVALTSTATGETGNGRRTSDSSVRGVTILQYIEGLVKDIDGDVFGLPESGPSGRGSGAVVPSDAASDWKAKRDKLDLEREYIDPDDGSIGKVEDLFDMSNVPIPDTSDSDGDHDPIKLMDYYTEVVNTRVNTVLNRMFPEEVALLEGGDESTWTDNAALSDAAEQYMRLAVRDAIRIPSSPPAPEKTLVATGSDHTPVNDRISWTVGGFVGRVASDGEAPPAPGLVRRRRSGLRPPSMSSFGERMVSPVDAAPASESESGTDNAESAGASRKSEAGTDVGAVPSDHSTQLSDDQAEAPSPLARAAAVWDSRPEDMTPEQDARARLSFHARVLARLTGGARARHVPGMKLKHQSPGNEGSEKAWPDAAGISSISPAAATATAAEGRAHHKASRGSLSLALVLAAEGLGKYRKRRALGRQPGLLDTLLAADTLQARAAAHLKGEPAGPLLRTRSKEPFIKPFLDASANAEVESLQQNRHSERQTSALAVVSAAAHSLKRYKATGPGPLASDRAKLSALGQMSRRSLAGVHWLPPAAYPQDRTTRRRVYLEELRRIYYLELPRAGIRPDIVTLNTIMKAYCAAGQGKLARTFLEEEFPLHGCAPDARTFRSLLRLHVDKRDGPGAEDAFSTMRRLGIKPDNDCYGLIVHLRAREWRLKDAVEGLREMKGLGLVCPEHYARLLRHRCKEKGIWHPLVPEHPVGWQFRPEVMKKRRSFGRVINKLVSGALRQKINGMR